ncbi:hypothetical protein GF378_00640 [Candidatus Pacearchaeota archaeon]|nr:hypothetical protein [Candidatus Pacearchaeota archaeon]
MAKKRTNKNIITCDEILGKEAIDPDGSSLGVVTKIHLDKKNKKLVGITIDMGFMKPDLYIGINYVKNFGIDAVFLKKVPPHKFKGLKVLSEGGELMGKVKEIIIENKKVKEFEITGKKLLDGRYMIDYSDIKEIGDHVILKKNHKKVSKKKRKKEKDKEKNKEKEK